MSAKSERSPKRAHTPNYILAMVVTTAVQAIGAMGHMTLPVLAAVAAADIGLSASLIGIYSGLIFVGCAAVSLPMAGLVPRIGVIRTSQGALLCTTGGLALIATGEPALLVLSALMVGAGYGPMTPSSSYLLAKTAPADRLSLVMSIKQTGVPIGYGLAGLALPYLAQVAGWRGAALAAAGLGIALAIAIEPTRRQLDSIRGEGQSFRWQNVLRPLAMVLSSPGLRRMAICSLSFSGIQIGVAAFLVIYLHKIVGIGLTEAGTVLAIANGAAIAGRILWGAVADRSSAKWVLIALSAGMVVGLVLLLTITKSWPFLAIAAVGVLIGTTVISWNGVFLAETARQSPDGKISEAMGGVMFLTFSGSVFGPPLLTGLLSLTGSYQAGFLALAAAAFLTGLMFLFDRSR